MQIIQTHRLIIRQLEDADTPALTAILSDPAVMEYSVGGVCDEAATVRFVRWCQEVYESHGYGPWALELKETGELVGFSGVGPEMLDDVEAVNLGYRLAQRFWGMGLATEAASAVLDYALNGLMLDAVLVIVEPAHTASIRVTEKMGLVEFEVKEFHGRPVRLYRKCRTDC